MATIYRSINIFLARVGQSRPFAPKYFLYASALSGIIGGLLFLFGLVAAHNVPAMKPYWDAETTAHFWESHLRGAQTGAALLILSGMFYLPFSSAIWWQMRRIPNLHPIVPAVQLSSAAAGVWTLSGPGVILAALVFRLERAPEITQAFTDFFWITTFAPWPTFMTQGFAWAYAVLTDPRPNPPVPKILALVNIIVPIAFTPAIAMHVPKTGPVAWDGALSFWIPGAAFILQLLIDCFCLARVVSIELAEGKHFTDIYTNTISHEEIETPDRNGLHKGNGLDYTNA